MWPGLGNTAPLRGAKVIFLFIINMLCCVPTETRTPMGRFWLTIFGEGADTPRSCRSQRGERCSLRGHDRLVFGADEPTISPALLACADEVIERGGASSSLFASCAVLLGPNVAHAQQRMARIGYL